MQTQVQELDKIADKIKKLFALSQSPNEMEASAAAAKAQEMLTRHNLSIASLHDSTPQPVEEEVISQFKRLISWKFILLTGVCWGNYCSAFTRRSRNGSKMIILGRKVNIISTRIQFEYLEQTITRLACKTQGDRAFKNAFKLGAANRLISRIIENREQQKNEGIAGNSESVAVPAIIVRALYSKLESELEAYLKKMKLKSFAKPSISSLDGYFSGVSAADSVSLDRQVNSSQQYYFPG
ncbi:DUF2786 domain-containing protein [Nostoc sp. CHAB 5836]|uniref:DUF2786 domain-containing protein n=1 Tax=Nostoc sp. CHAB 5836 TaxID=2780404 RepID=UPI001E3DDF8F|nr:DUF2786 domain-containing protein [Nostoc sp. CHAB 5836]MCC5617371.1 DUF2786 domain-containing protein [Nostoc sp. CHAB 5836]